METHQARKGRNEMKKRLAGIGRMAGWGFVTLVIGLNTVMTETAAKAQVPGEDVGTVAGGSPGCAKVKPGSGSAPRAWRPAGGETLAVADLQAESVSASDASVITSLLRGELVKTGRFKVVEKANMDKILQEQAFQQTGCTSSECAVKLGRVLNVKLMIVGEFGKLMGDSFVNVRVIDVETGLVVHADKAKGNTSDALENAINSMAARLAGGAAPAGGYPASE